MNIISSLTLLLNTLSEGILLHIPQGGTSPYAGKLSAGEDQALHFTINTKSVQRSGFDWVKMHLGTHIRPLSNSFKAAMFFPGIKSSVAVI